jgi:hypothetical protein
MHDYGIFDIRVYIIYKASVSSGFVQRPTYRSVLSGSGTPDSIVTQQTPAVGLGGEEGSDVSIRVKCAARTAKAGDP